VSDVFITGGTGYIGSRLIPHLAGRGHAVCALVRPGSESRLPPGARAIVCSPLESSTFSRFLRPGSAFIQLLGVPHPSPSKAEQFRQVDLVSVTESLTAAKASGVGHFIYVSVAHPAPAMRAFVDVRSRGEGLIRSSGMAATILRPWYVLGPGHRWPYLLLPAYWICERIPATRDGARRLGLVTIGQMVGALLDAVDAPPRGVRIVGVEEIQRRSPFTVTCR
jgi:nucleoside-diphosphate-sugar epimerase